MSNYNLKAKNKQTGEIVEYEISNTTSYVTVYIKPNESLVIRESYFNELYEIVEDPNHPYGGVEVLDNVPKETWEDRFNTEFVDEDTGLLNISKYDHDRIINFFNKEIK